MSEKISNKRAMEKMTSDLSRLLQKQNFESEEDLQAYLDDMVKGKKFWKHHLRVLLILRRILCMRHGRPTVEKIVLSLPKKHCLSISPNCADAYNLLAEEEKELYQKGVEVGRHALGEKVFKEDIGYFWRYLPTRPYMRSLAGLRGIWEILL